MMFSTDRESKFLLTKKLIYCFTKNDKNGKNDKIDEKMKKKKK